jgi:hypothetical protein
MNAISPARLAGPSMASLVTSRVRWVQLGEDFVHVLRVDGSFVVHEQQVFQRNPGALDVVSGPLFLVDGVRDFMLKSFFAASLATSLGVGVARVPSLSSLGLGGTVGPGMGNVSAAKTTDCPELGRVASFGASDLRQPAAKWTA